MNIVSGHRLHVHLVILFPVSFNVRGRMQLLCAIMLSKALSLVNLPRKVRLVCPNVRLLASLSPPATARSGPRSSQKEMPRLLLRVLPWSSLSMMLRQHCQTGAITCLATNSAAGMLAALIALLDCRGATRHGLSCEGQALPIL